MSGGAEVDQLPVGESVIRAAKLVFDVVAVPEHTPMIRLAQDLGLQTITGRSVMTLQAVEQFVLYTGVRPSAELIAAAADFANS